MSQLVSRLGRGYLFLLRRVLHFLVITVVVAVASVAITVPVWALSMSAPIVLNVTVAAALALLVIKTVGFRPARWVLLAAWLAVFAGILLAFPILSVAGGVFLLSRAALSLNGT